VTISAVIPTKNRPADLLTAVQSICRQSRRPDQLIIVDQSADTPGRERVSDETREVGITLSYLHDPAIGGLVAAKAASLDHATGDLICFLEDDVVLDHGYFQEMERGFVDHPEALGCSGVITNPTGIGVVYRLVYDLFHRGVFADPRPRVYARVARGHEVFEASNIINGGLSAWRREVFQEVGFDVHNQFHMMEDAEFSTRVSRHFGRRLFINSRARLLHHPSPANRDGLLLRQERKVTEYILFYKKNRSAPYSHLHFSWLLLGLLMESVTQSARLRTLIPVRGFVRGVSIGARRVIVVPGSPSAGSRTV